MGAHCEDPMATIKTTVSTLRPGEYGILVILRSRWNLVPTVS